MDFLGAADWVRNNKKKIRRRIEPFLKYSPYEECDYMQEAFLSALVASKRSTGKGIPFEAAFWTVFKESLVKMTPNPEYASSGSNSVPSHLCVEDVDSVVIPQTEVEREQDVEVIYDTVCQFLTRREQRVLCLAIGATYEGAMSNYEIAGCLGCRESNVRDALNSALGRVRNLVSRGIIRPDEFWIRSERGKETIGGQNGWERSRRLGGQIHGAGGEGNP
ncbi:MAG: sigma-70 family RNA polymerase sigma factor [Desulfuromonadales bacterium]|nr:sigma-70 family RNA polymerase sigma factor [Desulfuromonadales bacterium]